MLVSMHGICKDFPLGKDVVRILSDVDLEVAEGEYVAIMGPSGSGKTTLMNLIGCLDVPTKGSYQLDGRDVTACNDNQLAEIRNREIGFVFQTFHLLPNLTALENVALPLLYRGVKESVRKAEARKTLEAMGLGDRCDHKPAQLSGGQCQRVAIARAMVGNPRLLLADEPTGALDSASGRQIMELFADLHRQGVAIIMITHDAQIASWADRVCHIRDGRMYDQAAPVAAAPHDVAAPAPANAGEASQEGGQDA